MMKISTLIICIIYFTITPTYLTKNDLSYWLPKSIVEIDTNNPNAQTTTTFGYNEGHELISITKLESVNYHIYTALITYNNDGLITRIKQTSSNPLIPKKEFKFIYENFIITQVTSEIDGTKQRLSVSYDQNNNIYSCKRNYHNWMFDFDEDHNLEKITTDDFIVAEISTNPIEGICKDILMQPALFLIQDQLEATNSFILSLYNTKEVKSIFYDGFEFLFENRRDEFENIVGVNSHSNPYKNLEFTIFYEMNEMKL